MCPATSRSADQRRQDSFAINYGIAGIGNESWPIVSGWVRHATARVQVRGVFLSSWPGGDPAMIVDNPANLP
jgi:hypothetical protein